MRKLPQFEPENCKFPSALFDAQSKDVRLFNFGMSQTLQQEVNKQQEPNSREFDITGSFFRNFY